MPCVSAVQSRRISRSAIVVVALVLLFSLARDPISLVGSASSNLSANPSNASNATGAGFAQPNYLRYAKSLRHWAKPIVKVYVCSDGDRRSAAQIAEDLSQSVALWNGRFAANVKLALTDVAESGDIDVVFVKPGTLAGRAIGRTDVSYKRADQTLTHAHIRIYAGLSDAQLVQVAAHELGHALGIQGHSPDRHDLMYAYSHLPAEITDRDYNTMALSYNVISYDSGEMDAVATDADSANFTTAEEDDGSTDQL